MPKNPNPAQIRAALPLSQRPERGADPLLVCNVCGREVDPNDLPVTVWREHDERDRPVSGTDALVFVGEGSAHAACRKALGDHPRLYTEVEGRPGYFPSLCGGCRFRDGLTCTHRDLKANNGAGLSVAMNGIFPNAIICGRRGRIQPIKRATDCAGRELRDAKGDLGDFATRGQDIGIGGNAMPEGGVQ